MMNTVLFIIICLLTIILIFEISNYNGKKELFAAGKTDIVYSNSTTPDASDMYANVNEEILVLDQLPGANRTMKFKYLRGPLNKYIAIYAKQGNNIVNSVLVPINSISMDLMKTLGENRVLINDNSSNIKYYIRFLDDVSYSVERKKANAMADLQIKYANCVASKKTTNSRNMSVAECKKELQMVQ